MEQLNRRTILLMVVVASLSVVAFAVQRLQSAKASTSGATCAEILSQPNALNYNQSQAQANCSSHGTPN